MSISGFPGNIHGNWSSLKAGSTLNPETRQVMELFGKGFKVVDIKKGVDFPHLQNNFSIRMDLKGLDAENILKNVAEAMGLEANLESAIVLIGGSELVKTGLKQLEKNLKKIDMKKMKELASTLGLLPDSEVVILAESAIDHEAGGVWVIQGGMKEIQDSI